MDSLGIATTSLSLQASKALDRLAESLTQGNTYEGHEMLKTAYYRFRSKKKMDDGYDLCLYGSLLHFKKGDFQCGVELATMLLDAYVDDAVPVSTESRRRLKVLLGQFPHVDENIDVVNAMQQIKHRSLKWLSRMKGSEEDKEMVYLKSGLFTSEVLGWKGMGVALPDIIRSGDTDRLYSVIEKSLQIASPLDKDLIIARSMLHVLEYTPQSKKTRAFSISYGLYSTYGKEQHSLSDSIAQCAYYVVKALERGSRDLTGIAIEALRKRVEGLDPSICDVAEELIHIYCKPDPRQMGQDPFGSIFQTLLRGGG
ncbi:hypothetical protein M9434_005885 [Picochlorum sp. BPE23]|nr:hypothetical protein M9434_005885 [Picochlorum sp. BPE23]KAI8103631.1 hypothetical protein M9435_004966 [Picochlorum sp. BPE23]